MSGGGVAALAVGFVVGVPVLGVVVMVLGLARMAAHADEVALEHERQELTHEADARPRTASQGLAVTDGRLRLVCEQLVAWPDDE